MRYFSTQRPLTPGAFPKPSDNKVVTVEILTHMMDGCFVLRSVGWRMGILIMKIL